MIYPNYRKHCKELANRAINLLKDHINKGIEIKAVVGVDGSPSCGVNYSTKNTVNVYRPGIFINEMMIQSINPKLKFLGINLGSKDYLNEFELFKS
jgi:predicted secreted protein